MNYGQTRYYMAVDRWRWVASCSGQREPQGATGHGPVRDSAIDEIGRSLGVSVLKITVLSMEKSSKCIVEKTTKNMCIVEKMMKEMFIVKKAMKK
eukprot:14754744-Heterocapsa_arctica.AAC.1